MPSIIDTMKVMGYTPNEEGVCFGMAAMSAQANLRKDNQTFVNRIKKIHNCTENEIKIIATSKDKSKEKYELQSFFDELSMYQGPAKGNNDLKENFRGFIQDITNLKKLSFDTEIQEDDRVIPDVRQTIINVFTRNELFNFAKKLRVFLKGEPFSLILTDAYKNHATHLGFDGNKWLSTNHDKIKLVLNSPNDLSSAIQNIFAKTPMNESMVFSIDIALKNTSETDLIDFEDFNFKVNKINNNKFLLSNLLLSCAKNNNHILLNEILNQLTLSRFSADELASIISMKSENSSSALYLAAECGHTKIMIALLNFITKLNINPHSKSKILNSRFRAGSSPFYIAAQNGYVDIVKLMLDSIKNLRVDDTTKMNLIKSSISLSYSSLFAAAQNGHIEIVKMILNTVDKLDISETSKFKFIESTVNKKMLFMVAQEGHSDTLKVLIDYIKKLKIDPHRKADLISAETKGISPLFIAAQNGHKNSVEILLKAIQELDVSDNVKINLISSSCVKKFPLSPAIVLGHVDIIKLFIQMISNLKMSNDEKLNKIAALSNDSISLLHFAAENGNTEIIKLLLNTTQKFNIDSKLNTHWVTAKYNESISALYLAVQQGHIEAVKIFVEAIKGLNISNEDKANAILSEALNGQSTLSIANSLVDKSILNILNSAVEELGDKRFWTRL